MNHERRRDGGSEGCWQIGPWLFDAGRDLLTQPRHEPVKLEPRLARLLLALAERPDEILSAEVLLASVWRDVVVTPDSVYQAIAQLRRALGDDPQCPALIDTLPRKGYRLLAPAQRVMPRRRASDVADAPATAAIGGPRPVAPPHALAGAAATAALPWPGSAWPGGVLSRRAGLLALAAAAVGLLLVWLVVVPTGGGTFVPGGGSVLDRLLGAQAAPQPPAVRRVLWVDDNPRNNERERASLAALGVEFVLALNTDQALRMLQRQGFDLVISDMGRPPDPAAGYTLLAALREQGQHAPYIIYTAACHASQRADAEQRGALACVDRVSELMSSATAALEHAAPR